MTIDHYKNYLRTRIAELSAAPEPYITALDLQRILDDILDKPSD